jgi:peptidoglycan/LPS O-acetylase OafA/YrhL
MLDLRAADEHGPAAVQMTGNPSGVTSGGRLFELDGLRAISILLVLSAHMLHLGSKFLHLNDMSGAMGMSLFFEG